MITLQAVTLKNVIEIIYDLEADENLVDPNVVSLAQAYAYYSEYGENPIVYAIYHVDTPVGFILAVYAPPVGFVPIDNDGQPYYYLWRMMIDKKYQNKGYGRQAMELLLLKVKSHYRGEANAFYTSVMPESDITPKFYASFGFAKTGEIDGDAKIMRLPL